MAHAWCMSGVQRGSASVAGHPFCWRRYHNQHGVDVRGHDFGGMQGIAALDPSEPRFTATYLPLIRALEAAGYKERVDLWGAPYDWRLAGDGLAARGVADDMQSLIETAYTTAGNSPVVLVAHSMVRRTLICVEHRYSH